jgi:hypothetical protein
MRDPAVNAASAGEAQRVKDAIESARVRLYWTLISDRRWADSRWSGKSPKTSGRKLSMMRSRSRRTS